MEINVVNIGKVVVIGLGGLFKENDASAFRDRFQKCIEKGHRHFLLDLSELVFICSMGLRCILELRKSLHDLKGELRLTQPEPYVFTIFTATHLDEVLTFYPTSFEAMSGWAEPEPKEKEKEEAKEPKKE